MYTPKAAVSMRSASSKAGLRQLEKGTGTMRQALPARRQSMLFVARHLAECPCMAIRQKHGIIPEPLIAARRPEEGAIDACLEFFRMPVRPRHAERRNEMRPALSGCQRAALAQFFFHHFHCAAEILFLSGPAR